MITLEEFTKEKVNINLYKDYGIYSVDFKPFMDFFNKFSDKEEDQETIKNLRLSIEIAETRYFFENLEKYKAFKKHFNLL